MAIGLQFIQQLFGQTCFPSQRADLIAETPEFRQDGRVRPRAEQSH